MIASATRRYGNRKGSCYLTHGADSYDKHGKRKTQRQLDRALIDEAINDTEPEPEPEWELDEWDYDEWETTAQYEVDEFYKELELVEAMITLLTVHKENLKNEIAIWEKEIRKARY